MSFWVWMRIASSTRSTPMPVISPVSSACFQDMPTKLMAPRLYTSSGCATSIAPMRLGRSVRSPSRSWMLGMIRSTVCTLGLLCPRTRPKTS